MAHIRYATQGEVSLENVHPFVRVWKGIQMCFSHNGECQQFSAATRNQEVVLLGHSNVSNIQFHPVGDTDSEAVFCSILNAMSAEFPDGLPTLPVLHEFLQTVCHEIVQKHYQYMESNLKGPEPIILNFLLACGPFTLFAYSMPGRRPGSKVWNGLHYIVREPPFQTAKLLDDDYQIDFSTVTIDADRVAVITTKPLTYESNWKEFKKGQLIMFDHGLPYTCPQSCGIVQFDYKRGLYSKTVPVVYDKLKHRHENNSCSPYANEVEEEKNQELVQDDTRNDDNSDESVIRHSANSFPAKCLSLSTVSPASQSWLPNNIPQTKLAVKKGLHADTEEQFIVTQTVSLKI